MLPSRAGDVRQTPLTIIGKEAGLHRTSTSFTSPRPLAGVDAPMSRLLRPEPLHDVRAQPIDQSTPIREVHRLLSQGRPVLISDRYETGLRLMEALDPNLAEGVLVGVKQHRIQLRDAPANGFLSDLYEEGSFALPFRAAVELNEAWRWFHKGVHFPVLGHRLHPFYGTYAPIRMTHLELFGTWLSQYEGPRNVATDVGTGCGILSFQLIRAGFKQVRATDRNPNAIESVKRELARRSPPPPITPLVGDLLAEPSEPMDVIVFNPPWTQGAPRSLLDGAMVFEPDLFPRFFDQAHEHVATHGHVVIVFSTLIRLVQPDVPHPIEQELERGRFQLVQRLQRKAPPGKNPDGSRRRTKEKLEVWELQRS